MKFHETVPARLWVNWNLCGVTSTWRARRRACPTRLWPWPGVQAWSHQALNISLRLWKATQDVKPSITDNRTGAMYDIYNVVPEEKRLLLSSPRKETILRWQCISLADYEAWYCQGGCWRYLRVWVWQLHIIPTGYISSFWTKVDKVISSATITI